jgi:hypothetical protein
MINPLQHIPIVSSLYRAATGESINPIARIAGDTLYGGVFGLASAGLSALGAAGDEMFASINDGKSLSQTVVAGLFGDGKSDAAPDIRLAQDTAPPDTTQTDTKPAMQMADAAPAGILQSTAAQSPILQTPDVTAAQLAAAAAPSAVAAASTANTAQDETTPPTDTDAAASSANPVQGIPLDRTKPAYGGVMDNAAMQKAQQNQAIAMAMVGQNNILAAQRQLRNSRFAVANPNAGKTSTSSVTDGNDLPAYQLDPNTQAAMQNMIKQLQASQGTSQYQSTAQMSMMPVPGVGNLPVVNGLH